MSYIDRKLVEQEYYESVSQASESRNQGIISIELESQVFVDDSGEVRSIADYLDDGVDIRQAEDIDWYDQNALQLEKNASGQPLETFNNEIEFYAFCFQTVKVEFEGLINSEEQLQAIADNLLLKLFS